MERLEHYLAENHEGDASSYLQRGKTAAHSMLFIRELSDYQCRTRNIQHSNKLDDGVYNKLIFITKWLYDIQTNPGIPSNKKIPTDKLNRMRDTLFSYIECIVQRTMNKGTYLYLDTSSKSNLIRDLKKVQS
ncbi:hypothetical protein KW787_03700 [Candidatus Pacearchaeota archaeon]|nr:hypothetical protein [Candidatus Pacearchaeota archaeon]